MSWAAVLLSRQEVMMAQNKVVPVRRYILKVESTGFLDGLDVGYKRRVMFNMTPKFWPEKLAGLIART